MSVEGSSWSKARLASDLSGNERVTVLASVWFVMWLGAFDSTLVTVVLPRIGDEFQAQNQAGWIGSSYLLASVGLTPLYGRLSDIVGRRLSMLYAVGMFTLGTFLCGTATSMRTLIVARFIAGCGGGGLMAMVSIVISDFVHLKDRAFYQGVGNLFFSIGQGLGGPVGGLVSDAVGWRASFLMQVPPLVVSQALLYMKLEYTVPNQTELTWHVLKERVDYIGSAYLTLSLGGLLVGLGYMNNEGLPTGDMHVWLPLLVFGVFLVLFFVYEKNYAREPMFPVGMMRQNNPFFTSMCYFLISIINMSSHFIYPIFFVYVRRYSPTSTGLRFVPNVVSLTIASMGVGWYMRKTGRYYKANVLGSVLVCVGLVVSSQLTVWSDTWYKQVFDVVVIVPFALGSTSLLTTLLVALIASVDAEHMAVATGLSYLFRHTGQVLGAGGSTGLLQAAIARNLHERLAGEPVELVEAVRHDTSLVDGLPRHLFEKCIYAYHDAFSRVYLLLAVIGVMNLICSVYVREYSLHDGVPDAVPRDAVRHQDEKEVEDV